MIMVNSDSGHTEGPDFLGDFPMPRQCPLHPPHELSALQAGAKVARVRIWDGTKPWLVTGYDEVRAVLSDRRFSHDTDRPGYPSVGAGSAARHEISRTFIHMDGDEHDVKRRMLTSDFTVRRIAQLRPKVQTAVDNLVDELLEGPNPVDLVSAFALPLPSFVICEILGVPYSGRDLFHQTTRVMMSHKSSAEESVEAMQIMLDFLDDIVSAKQADPGDDLVSRLVVDQLAPGRLTRHELISMLLLLLTAGHDTTANMIALGTLTLLQHPVALAEVRSTDDPALIANTVEELLRWLTIVDSGARRVAVEDVEIAGFHISAGDAVIAAQDVANRDTQVFAEPDTFDIHRNARRHVAFSYGIHQCLGQNLARMELQVVLATLYRRIPNLALVSEIADISFKESSVYGVEELMVTW